MNLKTKKFYCLFRSDNRYNIISQMFHYSSGEYHRGNDLPAFVRVWNTSFSIRFHVENKLHRNNNLPAYITQIGAGYLEELHCNGEYLGDTLLLTTG